MLARSFCASLLAFVLAAPAAHALSVQISPGPIVTVSGGYTQSTPLQQIFTLTNNSTSSVTLGLQRQVISEVAGSQNNFCFSTGCYPPSVSLSPQLLTLAPGATDNSFITDYEPQGYSGITVIRYALFDADNADTAYVTVTFDASRATNGLAEELAQSPLLGTPFPNPAAVSESVMIPVAAESLTASHRVQLTNLADGRLVRQYTCQSTAIRFCGTIAPGGIPAPGTENGTTNGSSITIATRDLAPGLYACTLVNASGRPLAVRRLVVQ